MSARPTALFDPGSSTSVGTGQASGRTDVEAVRAQFPILTVRPYGNPLAYLDSGATSQKPRLVIDAMAQFFSEHNASVRRSVRYLAERATEAREGALATAQGFLNTTDDEEIVFTRGATKGASLVAATYVAGHLGEGNEVPVTEMEHHSKIVPWQMLCERQGAQLRVAPISDADELPLGEMSPHHGGSDMALTVRSEKTVYNRPPYNFEAGTPDLAGAVGLRHETLAAHEHDVLAYGLRSLSALPGLRLIGTAPATAPAKASIVYVVLDGAHPHGIGTILDRHGTLVRAGHHCAQPSLSRFGLAATARASLTCYSTRHDIDARVGGLGTFKEAFH